MLVIIRRFTALYLLVYKCAAYIDVMGSADLFTRQLEAGKNRKPLMELSVRLVNRILSTEFSPLSLSLWALHSTFPHSLDKTLLNTNNNLSWSGELRLSMSACRNVSLSDLSVDL